MEKKCVEEPDVPYEDSICARVEKSAKIFCSLLPGEAREKCFVLLKKVVEGKLDGKTAHNELLKYVDADTIERALNEAKKALGYG